MSELTRRQRNIIRRMCEGQEFYTAQTPRMTLAEARMLSALGLEVQEELADSLCDTAAGKVLYPLHPDRFRAKAQELGVI